jgi:hypothetical protein
MHLVPHDRSHLDPEWEIASATPIRVTDAGTVARLAAEIGIVEHDGPAEVVLVAVRHPTGWFVHAARRDDLTEDDVAALRELVTVRTYLLLTGGPQGPMWLPVPGVEEWRSVALPLGRHRDVLDDVLVD